MAVEVEPYHLDRPFDYLVGDEELRPGQRVEVVFAGRVRKGLVLALVEESDVPASRLRPVKRALGEHVWMTPEEFGLVRWAADRWGGPAADVLRHALPGRTVDVERRAAAAGWFPRAERVAAPPAGDTDGWVPYGEAGAALLDAVRGGGESGGRVWRPLPDEDVAARVTELVRSCLAADRDVLVVVPDPVSPVADAVVAATGDLAVDAREAGSGRVTYRRWLQARTGQARVVVGGRGVVFWPLERLGLVVVLDEANPAHKERRSPRHHVREVALERARRVEGVAVLVGTVASAPTWRLLREGRVTPVAADRATELAAAPRVVVDTDPRGRIGTAALSALRAAVAAGSYGVVLATRRGEGRALACRRCGEALRCPSCSSSVAADGRGVLCEGCGWRARRRPRCPGCREEDPWVPLAAGAQRLAHELGRSLPGVAVVALEGHAPKVPPAPAVLVVTRGAVLDAPPGPVGAVVLPDLDSLTRRPVLDADEDALRLATTLAGWVARTAPTPAPTPEPPPELADIPPDPEADDAPPPPVVVQTREPDHPVVAALADWDPSGYWRAEARARAELGFPPSRHALRVDAPAASADEVGARLRDALRGVADVLGPLRDGDRARWLVKADDRRAVLAALHEDRLAWSKAGDDVRVDVDPVDVA